MDIEGSYAQSGSLETVRALHQTIVALRTALEASKNEILELKQKSWPIESVQNTLTTLSIENHALRQQILDNNLVKDLDPSSFREGLIDDKNIKTTVSDSKTDQEDLVQNRKSGDTHYNLNKEPQTHVEDSFLDSKDISGSTSKFQKYVKFEEVEDCQSTEISHLKNIEPKNNNLTVNTEFTLGVSTPLGSSENVQKVNADLESKNLTPPIKYQKQFCHTSPEKQIVSPKLKQKHIKSSRELSAKFHITATKKSKNKSKSLESLTVLEYPVNRKFTFSKTVSFSNLSVHRKFRSTLNLTNKLHKMDEQEKDCRKHQNDREQIMQDLSPQNDLDQEVDDIELIFTTDDTDTKDFKEELVPIDERQSSLNLLQMPLSDYDQISDRELEDDVFNDNNEGSNFHSFEIKKDNSILNFQSDNSINQDEKSFKSYYSYHDSSFEKSFENKSIEKDESFDRFEERVRMVETDISKIGIQEMEYVGFRRNTCPNPVQYRPLSHRDAMAKGMSSRKTRPILTHSNAVRKESGAQTDISAIPGTSWRSESSLAHKVKGKLGDTFTTLPSKIPHPGSRLRLSEKTVEARRVLLSDIGFTSMVPELSRSADHLCPGNVKPPTATTYGQYLRATDLCSPNCASQKFTWTATTTTPSDVSRSQSRYGSGYPLYSPPAPSRRCSAPVSPSRRALSKPTLSKVRFANGSLPELRSNWTTVDSDSTDSLVEEAENYLRRSIDCIATGRDTGIYSEPKRTVPRRASAPEPCRDNVPPSGWQPFLPRLPRDLKLDHWVKVITPEGKVRGGRVRYVGLISSQGQDHFIGVQLACPEGVNDGTWGNRRYFQCEPCHGIFVPFKKVIMGWRP